MIALIKPDWTRVTFDEGEAFVRGRRSTLGNVGSGDWFDAMARMFAYVSPNEDPTSLVRPQKSQGATPTDRFASYPRAKPINLQTLIRTIEFNGYLDRISSGRPSYVTPLTAGASRALWEKLSVVEPRIPIPCAGATDDGRLILTWDAGDLTLGAELHQHEPIEWYGRNRKTCDDWYEEALPCEPLPRQVVAAARAIAMART